MPAATSTTTAQDSQELFHAGLITQALALLAKQRNPSVDMVALELDCRLARGEMKLALELGDQLANRQDTSPDEAARIELALGGLVAATGRDEEAVAHFRAAAHLGAEDPVARPWRTGAALSLMRSGGAREAGALATEHLALARDTDAAYAVAEALRTAASCLMIDREKRLREAHHLAQGHFARLTAQVATDLAGLLALTQSRADHEEAVTLLRGAEEYADAEDLWPLHTRVHRLLERLGETPQVPRTEILARLTDSELRVARLAARGGTNRAIAADIGASIKSVEWHLSHAYRKLGIRGRTELPRALRLA